MTTPSAELDRVVRLVRAKPGTPAAEHLDPLTGGDPAAVLDALVALNDVAAAAGDGELYHAVLFAFFAFDDDRAWASPKAWLDAWRAAGAPDNPGSPLGSGVEAMFRTGPAARVFATLGPHVADFRDAKGPRPIAARALQEAYLFARRGGALDPGWFELASSMLDAHADLALALRHIVALTDHPRRLDLLLERVERGAAWPGLYEGLGRIADERAEAVLQKVLAEGADADALEAARGLGQRGAKALAPLVVEAVCRIIPRAGKTRVNLNVLRDALLPLATPEDAPKLRAAAKLARKAEGFVSAKERTEFARDVDGLAKTIAERG
ncbi:MAG: hypothetical protein KJ015_38990 [Myxococcales bacterium]|nr:hypothetical protein [Myxococcales bacterium]